MTEQLFQLLHRNRRMLSAMPRDEDAPLTLDWALIESWKDSGIPLQAVRRIARAFEKSRPGSENTGWSWPGVLHARGPACCREAQSAKLRVAGGRIPPPFAWEDILRFLTRNAESVEIASRKAREQDQQFWGRLGFHGGVTSRNCLAGACQLLANLEELEIRLTALEEKLTASHSRLLR